MKRILCCCFIELPLNTTNSLFFFIDYYTKQENDGNTFENYLISLEFEIVFTILIYKVINEIFFFYQFMLIPFRMNFCTLQSLDFFISTEMTIVITYIQKILLTNILIFCNFNFL